MKLEIDNLDKTFRLCTSTGKLNEKTIDFELIASLKAVAEKSLEFVRKISTTIPKESTDWTFVFRDYYESLRNLYEITLIIVSFRCYFLSSKLQENIRKLMQFTIN